MENFPTDELKLITEKIDIKNYQNMSRKKLEEREKTLHQRIKNN